jgi:hypothetical protein
LSGKIAAGGGMLKPSIGDERMKLTPPKVITFIIAVILVVLGLIGKLAPSTPILGANNSFWFVFAGFVLLALGNLFKGL